MVPVPDMPRSDIVTSSGRPISKVLPEVFPSAFMRD